MHRKHMQEAVENEVLSSYKSMYRMAYTYVKNEQDAMDIVQESVYKAIRNCNTVRNDSYIKTWLFKIVINTALDFIRTNQREIQVESIFETGTEDKYTDFDTLEALNVLSEKEKAVIMLRFFEDKKLDEVAVILDLNISTVKSILYRSLRKLKIKLMEGEMNYEQQPT